MQYPDYTGTFVFENDFAALRTNTVSNVFTRGVDAESPLLIAESERCICRVVCFSPQHDLTLADMDPHELRRVVDTWSDQYTELGSIPWINYVQIFENRGAIIGESNPHPHGQTWANERIPNEPAKESHHQHAYTEIHSGCLLCDYLTLELEQGKRLVCQNDHFVALVPFWAIWPFETLVLPREHYGSMPELSSAARTGLARILQQLTNGYNQIFQVSFPYSMGFHQKPTDCQSYPEWHLHAHFYPPLLRSAKVRKFIVG